jgi:FMN phosphatase YigB (HAD superfamily)
LPPPQELDLEGPTTLFFDDSMRNIAAAHEVGIRTVIVGKDVPVAGADCAVLDFHHLPRVMPELFDQPGEVHVEAPPITISVRA